MLSEIIQAKLTFAKEHPVATTVMVLVAENPEVIKAGLTFVMAHPVATVVTVLGVVAIKEGARILKEYINKDSKNKDEDRDVDNNRRGKIRKS